MQDDLQNKSDGINEKSLLKEKEQTQFMRDRYRIKFFDKNLIPSFMGDHSGYYSDLAPVPHYDPIEIIFEILGIGVLIVTWIFFQLEFNELDDEIPIIFNSVGKVVRSGTKLILYLFPTLDTFIFVILSLVQFITNRFRYSISVTPENSSQVFQTTRKLILYIKFFTTLVFVYLSFATISVIKNQLDGYKMAYGVFFIFSYGCFYYWYMIQLQKITDRQN